MTAKDLPTPATLRKLLSYDPGTGLMVWKRRSPEMFTDGSRYTAEQVCTRWNTRFDGKPAFETATSLGYFGGRVFGKIYFAHRVAYAIHHGAWPHGQVDHISGVKTDNRIANLRDVSHSENLRNAAISSNNTSGACGVSWNVATSKWRAQIRRNREQKHLGTFDNFDDAVAARAAAEVKYGYHPNHGRPHLA